MALTNICCAGRMYANRGAATMGAGALQMQHNNQLVVLLEYKSESMQVCKKQETELVKYDML